jgi:hypothetical protein
VGDWISVDDRIPESGKRVVVVAAIKGGARIRVLGAWWFDSQRGEGSWGVEYPLGMEPTVTHWAYLPDIPKEAT